MPNFKDIDTWRMGYMAVAELVDTFRLMPRALVVGYGIMTWTVVKWYMTLEPKIIPGCNVELLKEVCVTAAPNTQHAAVLTAVIGGAAGVFAFYANTGKKWNGFTPWKKKAEVVEEPTDSA